MAALARDPDWQIVPDVPFVAQRRPTTAGRPRSRWCSRIFACRARRGGRRSSPAATSAPARCATSRAQRGLDAFVVSGTFDDLFTQVARGRPVVVGLAKPMALTGGRALAHYEVVIGLNRSRRLILSLDPAAGVRENTLEGFAREWAPTTPGDDRRFSASRRRAAVVGLVGLIGGAAWLRAPITFDPARRSPPRRCSRARRAASSWAPRRRRIRSKAAPTTTGPSGRRAATPTARRTSRTAPSAARIADSWNLWRSDLAALQLIGANAYRLGDRMEPARARARRVGRGGRRAIPRDVRRRCAPRGITPIVTLYHFTLPTWVAARGGWDWDGRARRAGGVRGARGRRVRRSRRLVVHAQRAQRAGRQELPRRAVAARRARSAARGAACSRRSCARTA